MIQRPAAAARRCALALLLPLAVSTAGPAQAQSPSKNLAPGFTHLARADRIALMPVDVELYSLSAGGVAEPKADWTADALGHMKTALSRKTEDLGVSIGAVDEAAADEFAEQSAVQAAVARSIALHHGFGGVWALPTKQGRLDWSLGDTMKPLAQRTGARYGLFVWVRDSYASAERKVAMVALALLGVGISGGAQVGYASLVDFETGQVLWFNRLLRGSGDLRDADAAAETINALMAGFPAVQ